MTHLFMAPAHSVKSVKITQVGGPSRDVPSFGVESQKIMGPAKWSTMGVEMSILDSRQFID